MQEQARPQMRRKSSAGTLLSFRTPSSSSNPLSSTSTLGTYPQPQVPTNTNYNMPMSPGDSSVGGLGSPSSSNGPARDWDAQSISAFSEGHTAGLGLGTSQIDSMRDTVNKRIMTLTYLRSTHEGKMYWFNTVLLTRDGLAETFNAPSHKKKAYRFAVLALSLAGLFEIQNPAEYLKALLGLMTEYEQFQDETVRPKQVKKRNIFRTSKMPKRGVMDFGATYDGGDNYLLTPNAPFQLDYHQTIISLADILSETYQKLLRNMGNSQPLPSLPTANGSTTPLGDSVRQGAQTPGLYGHHGGTPQMFGPLGVITPYPGLTSVWAAGPPDDTGDGSLWALAAGGPGINIASSLSGGNAINLAKEMENMKTIDSKFKKIIASLLKELDGYARNAIKAELESLDPLLKNLVLPEQMQGEDDFA